MSVDPIRPPPQNPVNLICFFVVEFANLARIEDVYAKLGRGFADVSSDEDVIEDWADLELTENESPYLLKFSSGECTGEMELIFSAHRLVQAGVQVIGGIQAPPVRGSYDLARAFIASRFSAMQVGPLHVAFNDDQYNGYVRIIEVPGGASMVFRMAELKWCEGKYGPTSRLSLS